ncbi:hypothetical protein Q765_03890 [Flavobacterium rivuli WB 3.3-2 = DSM 21788]|uniref:DUF1287 domain-containing protein n=1 Tax=Flavobacterium rivuli WB 3.3-2 = DSM 21788 TaxID=1121895 RepID=A0A0A2M9A4_9FLAO|nr:DUF1287 domain-containing protein [Flavobacterium rivuli]KGO88191.1 hypothetical protein Q765_03890 [Flavobacterium rivuli WB 3.3-2 = DSM 21788]
MRTLLFLLLFGCTNTPTAQVTAPVNKNFYEKLSDAALLITHDNVSYDSAYYQIPYPNGDVPKDRGVCTDVVIRSYRKLGIDLQKEVHEDMAANFASYPKSWGLKTTDTNIDHRRVPNLQVFFTRKGKVKTVSDKSADYKPGDIVTWMLASNRPHIGIVVDKKGAEGRYKVVHNIGRGQVCEDVLFAYTITGHYRYKPVL